MSKTTIPKGGITADAIDGTLLADNAIDSEHYTDGSIDTAHVADSQITAAKTSGVAGLAEADGFRLISDMSSSGTVVTNLERIDDATFSKMGTGMSLSSGVFTFPSTGLYQVTVIATLQIASSDGFASVEGQVSSNTGSSFDTVFEAIGNHENSNTKFETIAGSSLVNVTNASAFKFRFVTDSFSGATNINGNTAINYTSFFFVKLGDSQ